MRHDSNLHLYATDLSNHLGCRHLTELDLTAATGRSKRPHYDDPLLEILRQRGDEHEKAYVEHLRSEGLSVHEFPNDLRVSESAAEQTLTAMRQGPNVIIQGVLVSGRWGGRSDVLLKVDTPSKILGDYSYEVIDTKLARETKGGTILQLCLYSDILGEMQGGRLGEAPEFMYVVTPGTEFAREVYRVLDYDAFYRRVKKRLEAAVKDTTAEPQLYPDPCPQCDICAWRVPCDKRRRRDDHLSLVAGISRLQTRELQDRDVNTLGALGTLPLPLPFKPERGSRESMVRVREQARIQLEGRTQGKPIHEILALEAGQGFGRLPEPCAGDVFFDFEGDPFIGEQGREYLFGYVTIDEGAPKFDALWAFTEVEEKHAFETFIDAMMARSERWPDFHIYHYAPYEPAAIKRLMGRYATRGEAVDRLLRGDRFVDLYGVVKQSLRASVEKYSIKDLEVFFDFTRAVELRKAGDHRHALQHALELGKADLITPEMRSTVEGYNQDDCLSTERLRAWLEKLRAIEVTAGADIPRPLHDEGAPSEKIDEQGKRVRELMEKLLEDMVVDDVPIERDERSAEQHARWLLAYLLEWHRRGEKAEWWELFNLLEMSDEDLLDEDNGMAGLEFVERVGQVKKSFVDRYRYPPQQTKIRPGKDLRTRHVEKGRWGVLVDMDRETRTIDVKKLKHKDVHVTSVFALEVYEGKEQKESLFRLGEWVAEHGVDADGPFCRAARDLLLRRPPRVIEASPGSHQEAHSSEATSPHTNQPPHLIQPPTLRKNGETLLVSAKRLGLQLNGGVLAIQGPPGSGKTYTGARMIVDLVRAGKKVGITANIHKVVRNLTLAALEAAQEENVSLSCVHKTKPGKLEKPPSAIAEIDDNDRVLKLLVSGEVQVAAGTAWLWAREDMMESVDVLFVDEAGQMAFANALAVAPAARNLVLLGDPQQLDEPQKGSQPEGTEGSALEHMLGEHKTMPEEQGLFLEQTYRLAPEICGFTSELFYENRLAPVPKTARQKLIGEGPITGAGLWFIPVAHQGNRNHSPEEVFRVAALVAEMTSGRLSWEDGDGVVKPIALNDILIVAPYNVQVTALQEALPEARVGTVDKFQGQEAPIVIYSLATSSPDDAPRGMEFLYSLHRLNVATSRAKCACILVASPALLEVECRTPRQMKLANAFCRYVEMAVFHALGNS